MCIRDRFYTVSRSNRVFTQDNNPEQLRTNVEEAKVTKTSALVMASFSLCWLPISIMDYIDAARGEPTLPRKVYLTYGFLVYLSSAVNPFIYGATHRRFRQEYKTILKKISLIFTCGRCSWRQNGTFDNPPNFSGDRALNYVKTNVENKMSMLDKFKAFWGDTMKT